MRLLQLMMIIIIIWMITVMITMMGIMIIDDDAITLFWRMVSLKRKVLIIKMYSPSSVKW